MNCSTGGMDGLEDLERWAADARAREAADARVRERWLRAQAEEETSLAGVLLALAERRETVVTTTSAGRRHLGVVTGVGVDFAVLRAPGGVTTLVTLSRLTDVRVVEDGKRLTTGDGGGRGALGVRLADVLAQAAGQRPRVAVQAGTASLVGDLRAVGRAVVTLRTGAAAIVYEALPWASEGSFLASG